MKTITKISPSIVALVLIMAFGLFTFSRHKQERQELQSLLDHRKDSIRNFQDQANNWHSISNVFEVRSVQALQLAASQNKQIQDLHQNFEFVRKDLKNLQYLGITAMQSNYLINEPTKTDTIFISQKDTIPAQIYTKTDTAGWYQVKAVFINSQIKDISLTTRDSITTAITWRRKYWIFGRKRYTQEIISHNPYTRVSYQKNIIVNH